MTSLKPSRDCVADASRLENISCQPVGYDLVRLKSPIQMLPTVPSLPTLIDTVG